MFTLCNYAEHELTIEVIALFKVPFFNAKSCKTMVTKTPFRNTSKKIKFSTLMANFMFVFLEII